MIETLFCRTRVVARFRQGPLGPYMEELATTLVRERYSRETIRNYLWSIGPIPFTLARIHPAISFALRSIRRKIAVKFQVPRPGCNSPIGLAAYDRRTGMGLRHLPLAFAGSALFRRKARARTVPSPGRRLSLALALVGPARHWLRRHCSSRVRVWPFPPFGGERKRSQTLKLSGGNTSWLTPNPPLKSASVASRLRFGRTEPTAARGTMSPSPVSTVAKDGDQWKSTQSFSRNDLLLLAKVADQAHSRIFELQQAEEPQAES